jgi:bifunctional enzyme CysN/CysC
VIRPQSTTARDYRGYAGTVASGVMKPGDRVVVLPSGFESTIAGIDGPAGPVDEAFPPMSVVVRLTDELDISRGDMLCRPNNAATAEQDVEAIVCWMDETMPLTAGRTYAVKHTSRWVRAKVRDLAYRIDVNTLHRDQDADSLELNEIGRVRLRTTKPLFMDAYAANRATGAFIIVDEATNRTVGAGVLTGSHAA